MPSSKTPELDTLVSDPDVLKEFGGISAMALHRWTTDPDLGFPPIIKIRTRNFRSRAAIEKFKADLLAKAIANRKALASRNAA